jgi:hypothetical protein
MGFKYVGTTLQTMQGKHFDLPWLEGTENTVKNGIPHRRDNYSKALDSVGVPGILTPEITPDVNKG